MHAITYAVGTAGLLLATACSSASPSGAGPAPVRSPVPSASPTARPSAAVAASGCPSPHPLPAGRAISIDYVDFVFHNRISYLNTSVTGVRPLPVAPADVGPVVFRVSCDFASFTASGTIQPPAMTEGASGYLPAGTEVHAVRGFPTSCRLTARRDGKWVDFLAQHEVDHRTATLPCAVNRPLRQRRL